MPTDANQPADHALTVQDVTNLRWAYNELIALRQLVQSLLGENGGTRHHLLNALSTGDIPPDSVSGNATWADRDWVGIAGAPDLQVDNPDTELTIPTGRRLLIAPGGRDSPDGIGSWKIVNVFPCVEPPEP